MLVLNKNHSQGVHTHRFSPEARMCWKQDTRNPHEPLTLPFTLPWSEQKIMTGSPKRNPTNLCGCKTYWRKAPSSPGQSQLPGIWEPGPVVEGRSDRVITSREESEIVGFQRARKAICIRELLDSTLTIRRALWFLSTLCSSLPSPSSPGPYLWSLTGTNKVPGDGRQWKPFICLKERKSTWFYLHPKTEA